MTIVENGRPLRATRGATAKTTTRTGVDGSPITVPPDIRRRADGRFSVHYFKPSGSNSIRTFETEAEAVEFRAAAWREFIAGGSRKAQRSLAAGLTADAGPPVVRDEKKPKPKNGRRKSVAVAVQVAPTPKPAAPELPTLGSTLSVAGLFLDDVDGSPRMMLRSDGRVWLVAVEGRTE